jgi:hypothetical protein
MTSNRLRRATGPSVNKSNVSLGNTNREHVRPALLKHEIASDSISLQQP